MAYEIEKGMIVFSKGNYIHFAHEVKYYLMEGPSGGPEKAMERRKCEARSVMIYKTENHAFNSQRSGFARLRHRGM